MLVNPQDKKHMLLSGYVIKKDIISKSLLIKLKDFYNKNFETSGLNYYLNNGVNHINTAMSTNLKHKKDVLRFIKKEMTPVLNCFLKEFKIVIANFIVKYPGGENECRVHQDISLIEENDLESSFTVWFSLDEINEKSSPLYAVPGTHRIFRNFIRGVGVTLGLNSYRESLIKKSKTLLPFNAGDILIMNPRTIHGSLPTPSSFQTRISIGIGVIPINKKQVLYVKDNDTVKKYFVNEKTMLNYNPEKKYVFKEKFITVPNSEIEYSEYRKILESI